MGGPLLAAMPGMAALGAMLGRGDFGAAGSSAIQVPAVPQHVPAIDIQLARANFKRWNDALQTKDAKTVANMYVTKELSFLPTVSPAHIKEGSQDSDTEEYFKSFVQKNPFGTITDDSIQVYG